MTSKKGKKETNKNDAVSEKMWPVKNDWKLARKRISWTVKREKGKRNEGRRKRKWRQKEKDKQEKNEIKI